MAKNPNAEPATPATAQEGRVLVGRDWQGQPIYAASADKHQPTTSANAQTLAEDQARKEANAKA